MGKFKSNPVDKWRREWEMRQQFKAAVSNYQPDVIIHLGDIIDEGAILDFPNFKQSIADFKYTFDWNNKQFKKISVPGNHDIGFYDRVCIYPTLINRLAYELKVTRLIELIQHKDLNILTINSQLFYESNPRWSIALEAVKELQLLVDRVKKDNLTIHIMLTHMPLFRISHKECNTPMSFQPSDLGWQGYEVLHRAQTRKILEIFRPKLVLSGHSHFNCMTMHDGTKEITLTSFNHKFESQPRLLLLQANGTHILTSHCDLISELHILVVYIATLLTVVLVAYKVR